MNFPIGKEETSIKRQWPYKMGRIHLRDYEWVLKLSEHRSLAD